MPRQMFYGFVAVTLVTGAIAAWLAPMWLWWWIPLLLLCAVGFADLRSEHNVLGIYPVIGHLRYMLEFIRPELRQYFFESEQSGRPFNRQQRTIINARADGQSGISPFGTIRDVDTPGFDFAEHSLSPKSVSPETARLWVGGPDCRQPYHASRFNISAMSFGSLSPHAILAFNKGAKLGDFFHDTGEGGISPYHLEHGGDLVWELGTGYFGCRKKNGRFDAEKFRDKANGDTVRMIEIKLSQGAKPSHGGLLPGAKVDEEIARTRGIEVGKDCNSPAAHPEFSTPTGLLEFVTRLRELADGKPVGFKLCLGRREEFMGICKAMLATGITPDFITVDGCEGGTGAAPQEFQDFLGTYINEAVPFVHNCLVGIGLRERIRVIASGKVAMGFDMVVKISLGADMCNAARPFMFSVGCIQARRCHTNRCPTGVTTMDPRRYRALNVDAKALRVRNFHHGTVSAFLELTGAIGAESPEQLGPHHIYHRVKTGPGKTYDEVYPYLEPGALLEGEVPPAYADYWRAASADRF